MLSYTERSRVLNEADLIIAKNSSGDTLRVFKSQEDMLGNIDPSFAQLEMIDKTGRVSEIFCVVWKSGDQLINPDGKPFWSLRIAEKEDLF